MDPVANITRQRELAAQIIAATERTHPADVTYDLADLADELAGLVQALDEWRRTGGFDPYTVGWS